MTLSGIPAERLRAALLHPSNAGAAQKALQAALDRQGHKTPPERANGAQRATGAAQRVRTQVEGLSSLRLTFYGAPRTKKTHNQLRMSGGRLKVIPSAAWMRWRDECLKQVHPWMRLRDQAYNVSADFYRERATGDAVGFYTGLADVLEEAGIVSNDRFLVSWEGSRLLVDREHPRTEITLAA